MSSKLPPHPRARELRDAKEREHLEWVRDKWRNEGAMSALEDLEKWVDSSLSAAGEVDKTYALATKRARRKIKSHLQEEIKRRRKQI